jgi:hypothetical protein
MVGLQSHHTFRPVSKLRYSAFHERGSWIRLLMTAAVFSVVTGAALIGIESRSATVFRTAAPPLTAGYESPLGLRVTSAKSQVDIRWDHASGAVDKARRGLLKITEGELSQLIPLERRDLLDGHVSYTPMTADVLIRLEVSAADGTNVAESARVVAIP